MHIIDDKYISPHFHNSKVTPSFFRVYCKNKINFPVALVYVYAGIDNINEDYVTEYIDLLPPDRKNKCLRYRNLSDKVACILSFMVLSEILKEKYDIDKVGDFRYNENGKPYLKEREDIFFSISHTKDTVAVAIAGFEIGIDVETIREISTNLIVKVASEKEREVILSSSDMKRAFFKLWTMKESYAKAYGIGVPFLLQKDITRSNYVFLSEDTFFLSAYIGRILETNNLSVNKFTKENELDNFLLK